MPRTTIYFLKEPEMKLYGALQRGCVPQFYHSSTGSKPDKSG